MNETMVHADSIQKLYGCMSKTLSPYCTDY